jgi:hypothetical protein
MPTTPDLLAEAPEAQTATIRGPRCAFCEWLETVPPKLRPEVDALLAHVPRIETKVVLTVLERHHPCPVPRNTIDRHRRGQCRG